METSRICNCCILLLTTLVYCVHAYLPTYYMDDWCSRTLNLGAQGIEAGRMLLRPPDRGLRYLNCLVMIKAPPGRRLVFRFRSFDLQSPFDCRDDHLQIFDDMLLQLQLTDQMCNSGLIPSGMYTSTAELATLKLHKENYLGDQIELIFTAFHLAPCAPGEFQCANDNCIHEDLYCNDYDNCGDGSDICLLNPAAIAGVVVAAVLLIIIIAVIIAVVMHRRKRRMEKEYEEGVRSGTLQKGTVVHGPGGPIVVVESPYSDAWDRKSVISDSGNSTASSRLSSRNGYTMSSNGKGVKNGNSSEKIKGGKSDVDLHPFSLTSPSALSSGGQSGAKWVSGDETLPIGTLEGNKGNKLKSSFKKSDSSSKEKENKILAFGIDDPLKSSTLKKNKKKKEKKTPGPFDIYAIPSKGPRSLLRRSSSVKYANDPRFRHPDRNLSTSTPEMTEAFWQEPFTRSASFREGMKGVKISRFPVHTLDVSHLSVDHDTYRGPDVYDHVVSFRSYPSPGIPRRDTVSHHPGYNRLYEHEGDRASIHSSRSSLVKL